MHLQASYDAESSERGTRHILCYIRWPGLGPHSDGCLFGPSSRRHLEPVRPRSQSDDVFCNVAEAR